MSNIPTHYSNRHIHQRYNKALYIVQHLPTSSNVQPTKDEKLDLYACYKQVTKGDNDTQRPGMFDVVGRAKWDAWKKLEGYGELEVKHRYVEILLQVAKEAYKKPTGRAQAHEIIHSFAIMQPLGDSGDSSSQGDDDDDDDDEESSSVTSEDTEELAYLRDVEKSTLTNNSSYNHFVQPQLPLPPQQQQQPMPSQRHVRSSSRGSSQSGRMSMMTAPTELRRLSGSSQSIHQPSSLGLSFTSSTTTTPTNNRSAIGSDITKRTINNRRREFYEDNFDDTVNPWVLHPSLRPDSITAHQQPQQDISNSSNNHLYQSPISTSSSVTATQHYSAQLGEGQYSLGRHDQVATSMVGPAIKRALESLHVEIELLNERVDGLRKEMQDRDQMYRKQNNSSVAINQSSSNSNSKDDNSGSWRWVIKAATKHATISVMTSFLLFLVLYRAKRPTTYIIAEILKKLFKLRLVTLVKKMLVQ